MTYSAECMSANLIVSWLETPYLIQGILIQSQEDIDLLKRYCVHVHIDIDRSEPFVARQLIPTYSI
jgi:hypothetical protein